MSNFETGHKTVDALSKINLLGNITPHAWFETLRLNSGKPDLISITLLSEFLYWHRSSLIRDERTGQVISAKKKFKSDLFQKSYKDITNQFGFSEKQIRESLKRLEDKGVLKRVFRTIDTPIGRLPNTMFIELYVSGIESITFPKSKDVFPLKETPIYQEDNTITEITTETSTEKEEEAPVNAFAFFENNISRISEYIKQEIGFWIDDMTEPVVLEAMKETVLNGARTFNYTKKVLLDWSANGVNDQSSLNAMLERRRNRNKPTQNKKTKSVDWSKA